MDERATAPGRGAYLCGAPACWQQALSGQALARALRVPLTAEDRATLDAYARALAGEGEVAGEAADEGESR